MSSRSRLIVLLAIGLISALGAAPVAHAAAPRWVVLAGTGPTVMPPEQSEVQTLFVDGDGGTYTLEFGSQTTAPIPFSASAAEVETALEALASIGGAGGSVQVTGGPGGPGAATPYTITFGGSLANTDVAAIATDASLLTGDGANATIATAVPGGPGTTLLALYGQNVGGLESVGNLVYSVDLPPGVTTSATPVGSEGTELWNCTAGAGQSSFTCTLTKAGGSPVVQPGAIAPGIRAPLIAAPGAQSGVIHFELSGGGAPGKQGELPLTIGPTSAPPGIQSFIAGAYDANGLPDTNAGDHPYTASTGIIVNTKRSVRGGLVPVGEFKDISVDLPPGFLGNPTAVPACPESTVDVYCSLKTMVGNAVPLISGIGGGLGGNGVPTAVYNTQAPFGSPAKFRFNVIRKVPLNVVGSLRSDGDYGITAASLNTPQISTVYGTFFTFWGAPADPSHDASRCHPDYEHETSEGEVSLVCEASTSVPTAFLTNATNCAEQASIAASNGGFIDTDLNVTLWQNPGEIFHTSAGIPPVTGCANLHFEDNFTFEPSDTKADSTASFKSSLTVPEEGLTDPAKLTTPELKDIVVQLPQGVVLNASGADGLQACSEQQIGFMGGNFPMPNPMRFNKDANTCPEASKIGTAELKSALLEDPLHGALYLAAQGNGNPFGSLFAIYLVIEDPRHGIFIKLPGEVEPDPQTGQMAVTFRNLPQLPFTRLDLSLKGGNRSALASPTTCGTYTTTATGTPWSAPESGPPTVTGQSFEVNQGPNNQPCAQTPEQRPFDLGWSSGSETRTAGASGPFNFQITRPDGSQELETLELRTPPGMSASLQGIPYCSEAQIQQAEGSTGKQEQASPACPAASQVGTVLTGAGSGPSPFYTGGKLYLAGPYKGAPFSVVAVTPAVAGPFDLGNVVVRSAVFINRFNAQVTAKTDPIPQILKGVMLRIKDVRIKLDRKNWTINPTSCEPSAVTLGARGNSGATTEKTTRFQVADCGALDFGPKLTASLKGGTRRGAHPAFTAEVNFPAGQANTKDVAVTLPHSEFLEQAHINTICTRVQAAAKACPAGSIYGFAEAETPLIDGKLTGPVFLKSSDHQLPDLAIALRGPDNQPIEVEFAGRIDSVKGQIRNTIEGLPDVPVSRFVLRMKGGRKGLLANSRNLCSTKVTRMTVKMVGHNNKVAQSRPPLKRSCKKAKKKKAGKHRRLNQQQRQQSTGVLGLFGG